MSISPKKRGFTLIELLVVIAIMGVLVSLLIPTLGKSREIAVRMKCLGSLRSHGIAMAAYTTDAKDFYPYTVNKAQNNGYAPINNANSLSGFNLYYSYVGSLRPFFCPTFNYFYWVGQTDNPYNVQKTWTPEIGGNLVLGYAKYAGTTSFSSAKPLVTERYQNHAFLYRDPNNEEPSWLTWGYYSGYQRTIDVQNAVLDNTNNHLGPAGVCLWADYNSMDTNVTSATAHNANAPFNNWFAGNNINAVTGMNEVMADGHARWYTQGNSSDGMVYTYDGQEGAWCIQNGY